MKHLYLQKLFMVGVVSLALLPFIIYYLQKNSDLNFFLHFKLLNTTFGGIFSSGVENIIRAGQQEEEDEEEEEKVYGQLTDIRTFLMQQNLSVNPESKSWGTGVYGLWMGNVSTNMLNSALQQVKKYFSSGNVYNVNLTGHQRQKRGRKKLLCQLKQQVPVRTLNGLEEPFASLGWHQLVPRKPLERLLGVPYRTCAVVASAGAILKSSLGEEIDSHDAVLRCNAAPTKGFESDVGKKTTIRLINSQILAKPQHKFTTSPLYKNVTLIAWDPSQYSGDLKKWYKKPDFDLFTPYAKHRKKFPSQAFYILHPDFIWSLWRIIQSNTDDDIQPNPPSSGFTGIVLMMSLCEQVDVYEFVPSYRHNNQCHYYSNFKSTGCTLGAYHPLLFEKLLIRRLSRSSLDDIVKKGKVTLPGFSQNNCRFKT